MELKGRIIVYSILGCPHCMRAKNTLRERDLPYTDIRLDLFPQIKEDVSKRSGGKRTVPQIFFNNLHIGGNDDLQKLVGDQAKLQGLIDDLKTTPPQDDAPVPPDPSTAVKEADPFSFQCEPDEHFLLVNEMREAGIVGPHSGGIFKTYNDSFVGKEFADWVKKKLDLDDKKAIEMGQELLDLNFARHMKNAKTFAGGNDLYILTDSDDVEALNSGPFSDCTRKSANEIGETLRKMILKLYSVFLSPDGKSVDYKGIKASQEFQAYKKMARELLRVDIMNATRNEKLAFFINIYNAMVIHANIEKGPPTSLWGRYKFFNNTKYIIGTHSLSLQDIENGVLRANRKGVGQFSNPFGKGDPRLKIALEEHEPLIHFGLVCGAKSCPPIKTYSAENVEEELDMAVKAFLENDDGCMVDMDRKTVHLSTIFKWYFVDFGKDKKELLEFVANHMSDGSKKENLKKLLEENKFKISYIKYDWSVNSK